MDSKTKATASAEPQILKGIHAEFKEWAEEQGVVVDGVIPAYFPGKGNGMVATKNIKKGDTLIFAPASALITLDSNFITQLKTPPKWTVHGSIAAALLESSEDERRYYSIWEKTWPSKESFEESIPLCWSEEIRDLLPPAAKAHLQTQFQKLKIDWENCGNSNFLTSPNATFENYRYYWLTVNTRCFYWDFFKRAVTANRKRKPIDRDECMALCPFADYFNHTDDSSKCVFRYDRFGGAIVADRSYESGEEVLVSYGAHGNDYLMLEYGFMLEENSYDHTKIDHLILPTLNDAQRRWLKDTGYLGNYTLDSLEVCYRTKVALRTNIGMTKLKLSGEKLQDFIDEEKGQDLVDEMIVHILEIFEGEIAETLRRLDELKRLEDGEQVKTVRRRWEQIREMVRGANGGYEEQ